MPRRSTDLHIRLAPGELRAWRKASRRVDEPLSAWIRKLCNMAAVPRPPAVPPVVSGGQLSLPKVK